MFLLALVKIITAKKHCIITHLNGDSSASFRHKFSSKFNPYVFLITLGQKIRQTCLISNLCVFVLCSWMRCIMYVLCTLPMYHLSTHDRNLYTFAQSTQCLYICSYFMSHMIFFIHVHVSDFARKQWKRDTYYQIDSMCVCLSKCECYDFITLFFPVWEK